MLQRAIRSVIIIVVLGYSAQTLCTNKTLLTHTYVPLRGYRCIHTCTLAFEMCFNCLKLFHFILTNKACMSSFKSLRSADVLCLTNKLPSLFREPRCVGHTPGYKVLLSRDDSSDVVGNERHKTWLATCLQARLLFIVGLTTVIKLRYYRTICVGSDSTALLTLLKQLHFNLIDVFFMSFLR